MKLDAVHLKKLLRNRDTWIVIGGAAAAITAFGVLTGRGAASGQADAAYAYPGGDDALGGGASQDDQNATVRGVFGDPSLAPSGGPAHDSLSDFEPVDYSPAVVQRPSASPPPVVALPPSPIYVDRAGNPATVDQIMAQEFSVAPTYSEPRYSAPSPARASASDGLFADRWGNRVTLDELLAQGPLTNSDARQSPAPGVSTPAPAALYIEPIVARSLKTPGGGLASPIGVETYMGGAGSPMSEATSGPLLSA